jgi:D-sedoheptulose 7-phosphate isomerase
MKQKTNEYLNKIVNSFNDDLISKIENLSNELYIAWKRKSNVFICGNGGSAGNAIHLANDFNYGIDKKNGLGLRIEALSSNQAVVTCLANDEGYENIYSQQLRVKANEGDILIVLSGSGNSMNIVNALEEANKINMNTFAILGFDGGKCKHIAKNAIHFHVDDMQVSEDLQMIVGHMCMQVISNK